jgi:hypothetical protein
MVLNAPSLPDRLEQGATRIQNAALPKIDEKLKTSGRIATGVAGP